MHFENSLWRDSGNERGETLLIGKTGTEEYFRSSKSELFAITYLFSQGSCLKTLNTFQL